MYDYGKEERYQIEGVDHEVHILGVKLGYTPYLLWGFMIGTVIRGPFLGIGLIVLTVVVCRKFYFADERGEPLSFDPRLGAALRWIPFGLGYKLFPSLGSLERSREQYRE